MSLRPARTVRHGRIASSRKSTCGRPLANEGRIGKRAAGSFNVMCSLYWHPGTTGVGCDLIRCVEPVPS